MIGFVVERWTSDSGHCPPTAYKTAFVFKLAFQIAAPAWFVGCNVGTRLTSNRALADLWLSRARRSGGLMNWRRSKKTDNSF
jgi:hypothetical protein